MLIRPLESEPGRGGGGRALTGMEPFLPRFSADSGVRKAGEETRGEERACFLSMVCFKLAMFAPLPFPDEDLLERFFGGMMKITKAQTEKES